MSADRSSPFWHYNSCIDVVDIVKAHENGDRVAIEGRLVNYLGVVIDPKFLPSVLSGMAGHVESVPLPANWHADLAEWAAVLRAVDLARDDFRVVELGCGWGCWLLNSGQAARRKGKAVSLIGVEADEGHIGFARQGCQENGFSDDQIHLVRAVVGHKPGFALFPRQEHAGMDWGLSPIMDATEADLESARASGHYNELPVVMLKDLVKDGECIDLLHIDIQGGEADFIDTCIEQMNGIVAYTVIGTHSREIEGQLFATMRKFNWKLEVERPAIFDLSGEQPRVVVDGLQGWRNMSLIPSV